MVRLEGGRKSEQGAGYIREQQQSFANLHKKQTEKAESPRPGAWD